MNNSKRRRLQSQNNLVVVTPVFSTSVTLDKAKELLIKGHRAKDLVNKYNILHVDRIELFKFEEELNQIVAWKQVKSTTDNKNHELSFITRKNEYQESLLDEISKEIRGIFKNQRQLFNFAMVSK